MRKQTRRLITISVLLIILLLIFYSFNIFNLKNIIHGISVNKIVNGNTTITTTIGKSLKLPEEFSKYNIVIQDNEKIINTIVTQTKNDNNSSSKSTEITITTPLSMEDVFSYYQAKFDNPITTISENSAVIIGGDAENLIKITIENGKYKIVMEQR